MSHLGGSVRNVQRLNLGTLAALGLLLAAAVPGSAQEIFSDDFESGGTIAWSDVSPRPVRQVVFEGFCSPT
jgi:hypothetical protein